jgi:hypothetical protein
MRQILTLLLCLLAWSGAAANLIEVRYGDGLISMTAPSSTISVTNLYANETSLTTSTIGTLTVGTGGLKSAGVITGTSAGINLNGFTLKESSSFGLMQSVGPLLLNGNGGEVGIGNGNSVYINSGATNINGGTALGVSGTISSTGLTTAGTVSASGPGILSGLWQDTSGTGTVSATNLYAASVSATKLTGTVQTAAQPNITSLGTVTNLSDSGVLNVGGAASLSTVLSTGGLITANAGINVTGSVTSTASVGSLLISATAATGTVTATNLYGLNVSGSIGQFGNLNASGTLTVQNGTCLGTCIGFGGGGSTSPGSPNTAIQYNSGTAFTGTPAATLISGSGSTVTVNISGTISVTQAMNTVAVSANTVAGTLQTAAQANVTSVGTLTALTVNGTTSLSTPVIASGLIQDTSGTGTVSATNLYAAAISSSVATIGTLTVGSGGCSGCGSGGGGTSVSTTTFTATTNTSNDTVIGFNSTAVAGVSATVYGAAAGTSLNTGGSPDNNSFFGAFSGKGVATGANNTAIGAGSMAGAGGGTTQNVAVGSLSLQHVGNSGQSTAVGYNALNASTGSNNTALGYNAGNALIGGTANVIIGDSAGAAVTSTVAHNNVLIGSSAGTALRNSTGNNVIIGDAAGAATGTISNSAILGYKAGNAITGGEGEVMIGANAGIKVTTGNSNTLVGPGAAQALTTGSDNVIIGDSPTVVAATGSFQLNVANAIYGNIGSGSGVANLIGINVTSPTVALEVSGSVKWDNLTTGTATSNLCITSTNTMVSSSTLSGCLGVSDPRVKKDIGLLGYGLAQVMQIDPIVYKDVREGGYPGEQIGLLAATTTRQGITYRGLQEVMPELVDPAAGHWHGHVLKGVIYERTGVVALKAIQDQQAEIEQLKKQVADLQAVLHVNPVDGKPWWVNGLRDWFDRWRHWAYAVLTQGESDG